MILSVSRRTDIPAFFSEWFLNRVREGYALVRNPMNPRQVSKVIIDPAVTDCIVFWTKNPAPMLGRLGELRDYNYYFHFTVNPYDIRFEGGVPRKIEIIDTFRRLADTIGPERVIWRVSPVLIAPGIDTDYHAASFEAIAKRLCGYTQRCMIGFIDMYKKTIRNTAGTGIRELTPQERLIVAGNAHEISRAYGIELQSCSGDEDLAPLGITAGRCIDAELIAQISGVAINAKKDKNQREICRCAESIDLGEYDSCPHKCLYCYANSNQRAVAAKFPEHDPSSPLLFGNVSPDDKITDRKMPVFRTPGLFSGNE